MAAKKSECALQSARALEKAIQLAAAGHYISLDASAYCPSPRERFYPCRPCWDVWGKAFPQIVQAIEIVMGRHPKSEKRTTAGDYIEFCVRCYSMFRLSKNGGKKRALPCPRCMPCTASQCDGCARPVFNSRDFNMPPSLEHILRCSICRPGCLFCGSIHEGDEDCELARLDPALTRGGIAAGHILKRDYDFTLASHPKSGDLNPTKVTKVKPRDPLRVFLHRSFAAEATAEWCELTTRRFLACLHDIPEGLVLVGPLGLSVPGNRVHWLSLVRGTLPRDLTAALPIWRNLDNTMTDLISYPPQLMPPDAWRSTVSQLSPSVRAPFIYLGLDPPAGKPRFKLLEILLSQLERMRRQPRTEPGGLAPADLEAREARLRVMAEEQEAPWRVFERMQLERPNQAPRAGRQQVRLEGGGLLELPPRHVPPDEPQEEGGDT